MSGEDAQKKAAAKHSVSLIRDGMIIGLGTGSTASFAIKEISRLVKKGFDLKGVPTSIQTQKLAKTLGIPLTTLDNGLPDITIDGADSIGKGHVIKGGGGALTREKIVAYASKLFVVIVDEEKLNEGRYRPKIPVEVMPFSLGYVLPKLFKYGSVEIRMSGKNKFVTDNGNYIVDVYHEKKVQPSWEAEINSITGVIANGIFTRQCDIIVGTSDGIKTLKF